MFLCWWEWVGAPLLWTFIGLNVQYLLVTLNLNTLLYTFLIITNSRVHHGILSNFIAETPRRCWRRSQLNNWSAPAGWLRSRLRRRNTRGQSDRARVDDDFSEETFLRKKCWEFWLTFQFKRRFIQILQISHSLTARDSSSKWKAFSFRN